MSAIEVTSGRRRYQGNGAPWEAWARVVGTDLRFGGWGITRNAAERMAIAALKRDQTAAAAGLTAVQTRTTS